MSKRNRRILCALTIAGLAAGAWTTQRRASADVLNCRQADNTVRVFDIEANACGTLDRDNFDWRNVGSPPWQDRIDQFGNDDFGSQNSMCLYRDINFKGPSVSLPPGYVVTWNNTVSSNQWKNNGC